jgi:hypothetical protein
VAVSITSARLFRARVHHTSKLENTAPVRPQQRPTLLVWVAVCVTMIPVGGLIGLALVVSMILALAEFMPTM